MSGSGNRQETLVSRCSAGIRDRDLNVLGDDGGEDRGIEVGGINPVDEIGGCFSELGSRHSECFFVFGMECSSFIRDGDGLTCGVWGRLNTT